MTRRARVILASAGSGKTWQLTTHFLGLLAHGAPPEHILASTFTRKAAGEILARVFERLARAASDERERESLDDALGIQSSCAAYRDLMARLAADVHRLRVRTLDAFFAELAQSCAAEVGLPPRWSIADELEALEARETALASLLEQRMPGGWPELLRELDRDADGRSVHDALGELARQAHELSYESPTAAWERIARVEGIDTAERAACVAVIERWRAPLTDKGQPHSKWHKALLKARERCAREQWLELFEDGIASRVVGGAPAFCGKEIENELRYAFERLARHAAAIAAAQLDRRNRAARRALEAFDGARRRHQRRAAWLEFDDLPRALAGAAQDGARADLLAIDQRRGARIDHLLLDEFQDTSPLQWRVLAPLAEALAADDSGMRSFFCVGDAKQSIYGFRRADPRLLDGLPARLGVHAEKLATSRRSAQVVLDAVNQLFGALADNHVFDASPADRAGALAFQQSFEHHTAHDRQARGSVHVHVAERGRDADERRAQAVRRAVELVAELRAAAPRASIAVLLRRNALASRVARRLRQRRIPVSDEGGSPLTDSQAVRAALAWLHWLDHPGDGIARFHAASSTVGRAFGLSATATAGELEALHLRARAERIELGLAEFLARAQPAVAAELGRFEAQRYAQLVELAAVHGGQCGLDTRTFVARVRRHRVEDPSAALVQVMTIHGAKGLEFDCVVLPELDELLVRAVKGFDWRREGEDPTRPIDSVCSTASAKLRALLAFAGEKLPAELHASARARNLRDSLGTLYVALTRARHRVDLVLDGQEKQTPALSAGGLVREAFGLTHAALEPGERFVAAGSDDGWMRAFAARPAPARAEDAQPVLRWAPSERARELKRARPSRLAHTGRLDVAELLAGAGERNRLRGSRMHAWLAQIEWWESFAFDRQVLRAVALDQALGGADLERDLDDLERALRQPELRRVLARPSAGAIVWRERSYRYVDGERLESGAFDRVVLETHGPLIERARIVDFKTDRVGPTPEDLARARESYAAQLAAYRRALAHVTGLEPRSIACELYLFDGDRSLAIEEPRAS